MMCISSARQALNQTNIDPSSNKVLFILSTTKGNVRYLGTNNVFEEPTPPTGKVGADKQTCMPTCLTADRERENRHNEKNVYQLFRENSVNSDCYEAISNNLENVRIGCSARRIAGYFHNENTPIAVSNACASGVCAQIIAMRAVKSGNYDYAVVIGADELSPFIITGFQSLKALSSEVCKPFDSGRQGLNLGEAAATIIYGKSDNVNLQQWVLVNGAVRNDANHISSPSRTGEGLYLALMQVMEKAQQDDIAFINAHGTATLYNDEMESVVVNRVGMQSIPMNSMKGYFGHTLGAAGVLETVLSMCAIDNHTILATRNFEKIGVSKPVNISSKNQFTDKKSFVKLISGFGGCNAVALFRKGGCDECD
ncbi:MAG: beta-ketoacyl synthase [Bacteroidales bacterium]|nr:beta-ketoacyl synthase [Candidatus Colimorpha onthohippi]